MYLKLKLTAIILSVLSVFTGCSELDFSDFQSAVYDSSSNSDVETTMLFGTENIKIHYIDVGQADSILIQTSDNNNMLIDAGETKDNAVRDYIDSLGITKFDIVVATHPHADHISEMADIINNYEIDKFYMPNAVSTSKTFEKMIDALESRNVNTIEAKAGLTDQLGGSARIDFLAPCGDYEDDLNNWSAVVKLTYGSNKFLFMGDAEEEAETDILNSGADVSADVLKVGHHGSSTSSTEEFLDRVTPKIAVISCGQDNQYGHPHSETIQKLNERSIETYITKDNGTVIIESNGTDYSILN